MTQNTTSKKRHQQRFSKLADHFGRNSSQATLLIAKRSAAFINRVQTIWTEIARLPNQPLATQTAQSSHPVHFQNQTLTIQCHSNIIANHLRFQQEQMLNQLHQHGFDTVKHLKFTLQHRTNNSSSPHSFTETNQSVSDETLKIERPKPSKNSLESLHSCSQQVSNQQLKDSLDKLYKRLKTL